MDVDIWSPLCAGFSGVRPAGMLLLDFVEKGYLSSPQADQ